jgi:hypothetical protein
MGPGYLWIRFGKGYDGYTASMAGRRVHIKPERQQ